MRFESRWASLLIVGAGMWITIVLAISFWRVWDIPHRLPEINEIATIHLFLFPISFLFFFALSWVRQQHNQGVSIHALWRVTLILWLLAFLHPVSCALYPAIFDLDSRTAGAITTAVSAMQVGMPRQEVERKIVELNRSLPIPMGIDHARHEAELNEVAQYLSISDPGQQQQLWSKIARASLVFVPMDKDGKPTPRNGREDGFQRRLRTSSDIGVDRIKLRYGPTNRLEQIVYSSNRQLTESRAPCTIHLIVPATPDTSFPYPCP